MRLQILVKATAVSFGEFWFASLLIHYRVYVASYGRATVTRAPSIALWCKSDAVIKIVMDRWRAWTSGWRRLRT